MDESADRGFAKAGGETGRHRTVVVILAVVALVLMALAWLITAPAAGALAIGGALL